VPAHALLKEMMDGSALSLSPRQQLLVGGWVAKTALVLILGRTSEPRHIDLLRGHLRHLLEHGTPPPDTTVRVAYLSNRLDESRGGFLPSGWPDAHNTSGGIVHVVSVPGLVAETLTGPGPLIRSYIEATKDDDRFVVVWPPHVTAQVWPPAVVFSAPDAEALRDAWRHSEYYGNFPTLTVEDPSRESL
jgi:hypothetical protein